MKRSSLCRVLAAALLLLPVPVAQAATKFWKNSAGSGNWSNGNNWSNVSAAGVDNGGAPGNNDTVNVSPTDGVARTITHDVSSSPTHLEVDLTGAGTNATTFSLSANTLTTSSEFIGFNGRGVFNHSGGTNNVGNFGGGTVFLDVGVFAAAIGTYNLSGTGALESVNSEYIGDLGTGFFNQTGGTNTISFAGHHLYLGFNAGAAGTYTISGGSLRVNEGDIIVGNSGTGTLTISGQASVHAANNLHINSLSTVNMNGGTLRFNTVSGLNGLNYTAGTIKLAGNRVINSDLTITGLFGATPTISSVKGLTVEGTATLGAPTGVTANVNGGEFSSSSLVIGDNVFQIGTLNISNGATVTNSDVTLGKHNGSPISHGTVNVTGAGSTWTINGPWTQSSGDFTIGSNGRGTLSISEGGAVTNNLGILGSSAGSTGTATVTGAGSTWNNPVAIVVGFMGSGALEITNGGTVSNGTGNIAAGANSTGAVTVDGVGSNWTNDGELRVGTTGAGTLSIQAGGTVSNAIGYIGRGVNGSGTVTVTGAGSTWTNTGDLRVGFFGAGTLNVIDEGLVSVGGFLTIDALGTVRGDGAIDGNVTNFGLVAPGMSAGALHIDGDYRQNAAGELLIELASASSYDQLQITDNATLDGTLTVNLINGFTPSAGQAFNILDWGTLSGTFSSLNLPALSGGLVWNTSQLYTTGVLRVATPGFLAADFDEDGDVDGNDLTRWRNNFGTGTTHMTGDADGDGDADGGDFLVWQRQLGSPPSVAASAAVPEPATAMLMMVVAVAIRQIGGRMRQVVVSA